MLLTSYQIQIVRPECSPTSKLLACFVDLDQDIGEALPFLNAELGGASFTTEPLTMLLKRDGRLITLHPRKIAITHLEEAVDADTVMEWLQGTINDVWSRRDSIKPLHRTPDPVQPMSILKLLPRTNCGECGSPTCLAFAVELAGGREVVQGCPALAEESRRALASYLEQPGCHGAG